MGMEPSSVRDPDANENASGDSGASFSPPSSRSGGRRRLASVAVVAALVLTTALGGVAGSATTLYLVKQQPTPSAVASTVSTPVSTQPIANAVQSPVSETAASNTIAPSWELANLPDLYERVAPSVVTVLVQSGGSVPRGAQSGGTGLFVDREGHVVTNYHVVSDGSRIRVQLNDGSQFPATIVGSDPGSDLAVLKVEVPSDKVVAAELGDSSAVRPGDAVFAVGSPFGLEQTVTAGIISAVDRTYGVANGRPMRGLIQTDAPVNPGNSGGPLFNAAGQVIGITTSIESPVRGSVGIGFAIPSSTVLRLVPSLSTGQTIDHPWLGISGTAVTDEIASALSLPVQRGILITEVLANSPAEAAGLRGGEAQGTDIPSGGDVIVSIDGREISAVPDISNYLDTKKVGDIVRLSIYRDGASQEVPVTLGAWPVMNQS